MSLRCARCCTDLQIKLQELIFPHAFLDADGLDFYRTHGLESMLTTSQNLEFDYNGMTYRISALGLIRPDLYLDDAGRAFHEEHGLAQLVRDNVTVRVKHRCQHLTADHLCDIYESRPRICRDFSCALRDDCTNPERT